MSKTLMTEKVWQSWNISKELKEIFDKSSNVILPKNRDELIELSVGGKDNLTYNVEYPVEGQGNVVEATVTKCKNGIGINYPDPYMRRRDPDCMVVNNIAMTDKVTFKERFSKEFDGIRKETLEWLASNEIILVPFMAGGNEYGYPALMVAPKNAAFFAASIYDLQGVIPNDKLEKDFAPTAIIYVAPPFRHTHFDGKQVVVHNQQGTVHEVFSYNLYPGPSAKKGVYGVLLALGLKEDFVTIHASTVNITTPYDNDISILHEGASGSGKSEMLEYAHREEDGRLLLGRNVVTGEEKYLALQQGCKLQPVTDDMALCHPSFRKDNGRLCVADAEKSWFVRIDHIKKYGTDPNLESVTTCPKEPLIFFNLEAHPDSTCLIWEHTEDAPGKKCPNPRIIIPREQIKNIQNGPIEIDYRSFGLRTPPCTKENPSYGIFGMLHILPPALAWLWRLVAPRGFGNPSITNTSKNAFKLESEGVGSFWPFATGKRVDLANILLEQFMKTTKTRNILIPNQHIGSWEVGFMAEWVIREYLARRGQASFRKLNLKPARHPLGGYIPENIHVEGTPISKKFFDVTKQPQIEEEGYDAGAKMLEDFFKEELKLYLKSDLHPLGKAIILCCMDNGTVDDYEKLIPGTY